MLYHVTLTWVKADSKNSDTKRHIFEVEADSVRYADGNILFFNDESSLVRGFAAGYWVSFTIASQSTYAIAE